MTGSTQVSFPFLVESQNEDSRFCVAWFTQYGFGEGAFGDADVLARAKGTSVEGLAQAGVLASRGGKVRLYRASEYPAGWDPREDERLPIWEACHQLCRAMQGSETEAGVLLGKMMERAEGARQLAYRLYTLCERKGWAEDARAYNVLVTSWHGVLEVAQASGGEAQGSLL